MSCTFRLSGTVGLQDDVVATNLFRCIRIMKHRAEIVGGDLSLQSDANGTVVKCIVRIKPKYP